MRFEWDLDKAATNKQKSEEMRSEYRFDHAKSKPNRFASSMKEGSIAVVLDPDVAAVFHSSEEVNTFLRSVISSLPASNPKSE